MRKIICEINILSMLMSILLLASCSKEDALTVDSLAGTVWITEIWHDNPIISEEWVNAEFGQNTIYFIDEKRYVEKVQYEEIDSHTGYMNGIYSCGGTYEINGNELTLHQVGWSLGGAYMELTAKYIVKNGQMFSDSKLIATKEGRMNKTDMEWAENEYLKYLPEDEKADVLMQYSASLEKYTSKVKINGSVPTHTFKFNLNIPEGEKAFTRGFTKAEVDITTNLGYFNMTKTKTNSVESKFKSDEDCAFTYSTSMTLSSGSKPVIAVQLYLYDKIRNKYIKSKSFTLDFTNGDSVQGTEDEDTWVEDIGYKTCPDSNHPHVVDLGLHSGIKWACCNVGTNSPEGYGDYFAWGATTPQEVYDWAHTPYQSQNTTIYSSTKFTKYLGSTISSYKKASATDTDALKTLLDPKDDAAHANWGGSWRMPTKKEQDELCSECTWEITKQNGVNGYKVTSKTNGNSLFLPATGYRYYSNSHDVGSHGHYWSSSLYSNEPIYAYGLSFDSDNVSLLIGYRECGRSVRPVCQ